ncbi:DUF5707 domain-containing protein [Streptomyces sp. JNUCC 64]
MKTRAFVALTTGALALTALSVPAAHADDRSAARVSAAGVLDPIVSDFKLNGGKDLVVGTSAKKFTVTFTAKHRDGVYDALVVPWRGGSSIWDAKRRLLPDFSESVEPAQCTPKGGTTVKCTQKVIAYPKGSEPVNDLDNANAGRWNVSAALLVDMRGGDGGREYGDDKFRTVSVKRAAKLSTRVAPGSVRRGADVTVKGDLTRANWDTHRYGGFASGAGKVGLQFKEAGGVWKTVKTVSADSRGKVKTTVKASTDGSYRFTYAGSGTTGGAKSAPASVDVR